MKHRRLDLDVYKGCLVWLVAISHIMAVSSTISSTYIFYFITSIHVPLFMGISGYLYLPGGLTQRTLTSIKRLIIPWLFANIIYFLLPGGSFSAIGCLVGFSTHLWYVPSLVLFMLFIDIFDRVLNKKPIV